MHSGALVSQLSLSSSLALTIVLPDCPGQPVQYQADTGEKWSMDFLEPPLSMHTQALWERLVTNWHDRRRILREASATIGSLLIAPHTETYLRTNIPLWHQEGVCRRIELVVPTRLSDWPWEISSVESIGELAVNQILTLVRRASDPHVAPSPPPPQQLIVELIGVTLDHPGQREKLRAGPELELLRQEIETVGRRGVYTVGVDSHGRWNDLKDRYLKEGPPHVFHFAGHSLENGSGLEFCNARGGPAEIESAQVAQVLTHRVHHRHTRLAFLNACSSAVNGRGPCQPFGGLGPMLLSRGVPAVVGMHTPILDVEAKTLAKTFYQAIAQGYAIDCAIQKARHQVFLEADGGTAWAFVSLCCAGEPQPLVQISNERGGPAPATHVLDFGYEEQRVRIERFVTRRKPMVFVVHGHKGTGHHHVARRIQHDLHKAGNVLWRPVASVHLSNFGEPLVQRSQLAGALARSLSIDDTGSLDALEQRLASVIAERCSDERVLVFCMEELFKPSNRQHANALLTLVHELWTSVLAAASAYRDTLPVFLILCVGYPQELPAGHRRAERARKRISMIRTLIEALSQKKRLAGRVRVEVLPELEDFDEEYMIEFLEDVLDLAPARAEAVAENMLSAGDNNEILLRMGRLLDEWRQR